MHLHKNEYGIMEVNTGDTPEMIRICLNCTEKKCIERCPKMLMAKGETPKRSGKPGVSYPYKGGAMTISEAVKAFGIPRKSLRYRIEKLHMTFEQAVEKGIPPTRKRKEKSV